MPPSPSTAATTITISRRYQSYGQFDVIDFVDCLPISLVNLMLTKHLVRIHCNSLRRKQICMVHTPIEFWAISSSWGMCADLHMNYIVLMTMD